MDDAKQGWFIKRLFTVVIAGSLFGLTVFGFEFLFSPYKRLPINGIIEGKRYTWGHLVKNNFSPNGGAMRFKRSTRGGKFPPEGGQGRSQHRRRVRNRRAAGFSG